MTTEPGSRVFDYTIDGDDVVVSLGEDWLRFARENDAPELSRESVIGHCLWEYVAGEATCELYGVIFRCVRDERHTLVLPFRCDSPDRFRFMQLAIESGEGRELRIRGRLLREQVRPPLKLLDRLVTRSSDPLAICSVCLRVQILGTTWVEAEEAVERLDLFAFSELPPLDYRVCGDCVVLARGLGADAPASGA
ncbi:MAG: hypothetical protein OEM05_06905 [Myxococcales bacterium]|nr:hypothetical protein [Myxococcales bacterium]